MPSKVTKPYTSAQPKLMSIGIDIGKDVFHIVGFDHNGKVVLYDADTLAPIDEFEVGNLPDMITFSEDGTKIYVANEGEADEGGHVLAGTEAQLRQAELLEQQLDPPQPLAAQPPRRGGVLLHNQLWRSLSHDLSTLDAGAWTYVDQAIGRRDDL